MVLSTRGSGHTSGNEATSNLAIALLLNKLLLVQEQAASAAWRTRLVQARTHRSKNNANNAQQIDLEDIIL
jgi:hypothetical protein